MKFGIFDHVDATGKPLSEFYEDRLRLAEVYDRGGFYCYHVAEHHFTPLGLAASPSVYLAAVSQRTKHIKIGPCVYLLSIYHPLRLLEEICMLDNMSAGRFQLGVGRGVSPFEMGYYGVENNEAMEIYIEAYDVIMKGLRSDTLNHRGKYFQFDDVPLTLRPYQTPHPPLWYGMGTPDAAGFCAQAGMNALSIGQAARIRTLTDRYKETWVSQGHAIEALPLLGLSRHVVVADTDEEARRIARRAYPKWRDSLAFLWRRHGAPIARLEETYPPTWDAAEALGMVIAGSASTVAQYVGHHTDAAGVNYFCAWFCFGDMTVEEASRSAQLFATHVVPAFDASRAEASAV